MSTHPVGTPAIPIFDQPGDLKCTLAYALGFEKYPDDMTAEPYLNYISNHQVGHAPSEEYLTLFAYVVSRAQGTYDRRFNSEGKHHDRIDTLIDFVSNDPACKFFCRSQCNGNERRQDAEEAVMHILGVCTMMLSFFKRSHNGLRRVCVAYNDHYPGSSSQFEYRQDVGRLISRSCLLPAPEYRGGANIVRMGHTAAEPGRDPGGVQTEAFELDDYDGLESMSFQATRLNAWRLNVIAGIEIKWTMNVSQHMLISQRSAEHLLEDHTRHVLQVFALPCAFAGNKNDRSFREVVPYKEIFHSYAILFNAWPVPWHTRYGRYLGVQRFCWCEACSAQRYKQTVMLAYRNSTGTSARSEFDPMLEQLANEQASDWTIDTFPCLWSRITALEKHLVTARPRSIWILLRDRRDTLQYYTFLFATVVVCLTIVQVLLAVFQVVGSFHN